MPELSLLPQPCVIPITLTRVKLWPLFDERLLIACSGGELEVRAVRAIPKGEQLTVSYINPTEPRKIRAMELKATKHFTCACERCTEPIAGTPDMMLEVGAHSVLPLTLAQASNHFPTS